MMDSPPRFRSLRWQLPLSYAAIALVAVLVLGAALIGTLRGFYRGQELDYLTGNAEAIAQEIAPLLEAGERASLQSQIAGFSFLTQTRVQVLDESGENIVADSGELGTFTPAVSIGPGEIGLQDIFGTVEDELTIVVEEQAQIDEEEIISQRVITRTSRLPAQGSLYGFNLGVEPTAVGGRSDLIVEMSIVDDSGSVLGAVQLSQGPVYGSDILRSVAWGWAIAGTVAVLLAAPAGWLVSRRLTGPLLALTAVTGRMAEGDLGARANVRRADELGILGRSFNRMAEQVENMVKSLRQFTADAAHELHTPLTALQTDIGLLAAGDDPAQRERVARAQDQVQRLQDLTDGLLELSRLEAESSKEQRSEPGFRPLLDLTQLVSTIGEIYASRAEQVDLNFEMILPDQPISVRGDEAQLGRAIGNVLDNSLKFTPAPGTINMSLAREKKTITITVRDSGIGIPQEDLPGLFTRFHRGRNAAGYPGSGLGLAIVHEIISRHDGRVTVQSGDRGTEIRLVLPSLPLGPSPVG